LLVGLGRLPLDQLVHVGLPARFLEPRARGAQVLSFPAIGEADEVHRIETIWGPRCFRRRQGEVLHPEREPLEILDGIHRTLGEYNFAGQY
jgi:hypothetical protein